jgi:hypothetical protein
MIQNYGVYYYCYRSTVLDNRLGLYAAVGTGYQAANARSIAGPHLIGGQCQTALSTRLACSIEQVNFFHRPQG